MKRNNETQSLKEKLNQKLKEKKLGRTSHVVREARMEKLQEKYEKASNEEKEKISAEIDVLNKIEEKQSMFSGEYPEYTDNASYGGGQECSD
jgi:hypothetical protein